MKIQVQVFTRGAFQHLNGRWLDVVEMQGTRVTVTFGIHQSIDFHLKEVMQFKTIKTEQDEKSK